HRRGPVGAGLQREHHRHRVTPAMGIPRPAQALGALTAAACAAGRRSSPGRCARMPRKTPATSVNWLPEQPPRYVYIPRSRFHHPRKEHPMTASPRMPSPVRNCLLGAAVALALSACGNNADTPAATAADAATDATSAPAAPPAQA